MNAERRRDRMVAAAIVAFSILAYLPVWNAGFVLDDHALIENGDVVAHGDAATIFASGYWAGTTVPDASLYRPITIATFALERSVAGAPSSRLAHVVNVVLHILTALALFALARRLGAGGFAAAIAGLMFALHPVHVEAVAAAFGRSDVLATLFTLLAIRAYLGAEGQDTRHRVAAWAAGAFLFLALGSKEIAVAGIVLLPAVDLLVRRPRHLASRAWWIERAASLAPAVLASFLYFLLRARALETFAALQSPHPVDNPMVTLGSAERIATALALLGRYAAMLLAPVRQSADYSGPVIPTEHGVLAPWTILGIMVLSALVVLVARGMRLRAGSDDRPGGAPSFAALLFLAPYVVIGNLLVLVGVMFAERFLYLPSAGYCVLAGMFLAFLAFRYPAFQSWSPDQRVRYVGAIAACLLGAFALMSFARAAVWHDDRTLFSSVVASRPDSPRGHLHLGKLAAMADDPATALEHLHRAVELQPDYFLALFEYGTLLARTGDLEAAIPILRRAIERSPQDGMSHLNLGIALRRVGRTSEARVELRKAVGIDPTLDRGWSELGHLHADRGEYAASAEAYRRAVGLGRRDLTPRLAEIEARIATPSPGRTGRPVDGASRVVAQ